MSRAIAVEIVGDASSVNRAFRSASNGARTFERDIGRSSRGVLAGSGAFRTLGRSIAFASTSFLGGYGFIAAARAVINESSRIQEETEKTGVVFAQNAKQVQAWSRTLTTSFGVSEGAALQAAGTFGNMLRPLGIAPGLAAKMSERLVELAADMASFNNTKPDVVLKALSSGLAGQVRPLRQYGVFLSETRINQEAMADGISKTGKNLTQTQKLLASYNIILKDTKLQQGDVARNTGSLSVAQSKFTAALENLEADLGRKFLPSLTRVTNQAAKWLGNQKNIDKITRSVNTVVHGAVEVFGDLRSVVRGVDKVTGSFGNTLKVILALGLVYKLAKWTTAIRGVAAAWGLVKSEAVAATAAEEVAAASGGGAGAAGVAARVAMYTDGAAGAGAGALGAVAPALVAPAAVTALAANAYAAGTGPSKRAGANRVVLAGVGVLIRQPDGKWYRPGPRGVLVAATPAQAAQAQAIANGQPIFTGANPTLPAPGLSRFGGPTGATGTFNTPSRPHVFTQQFALTFREQLAQAQAGLTSGTADDVAAAKQVVARIKRLVAGGRLKGKALLQALGEEASAISTIQSAEAAAAQKRAEAAARAKARIQRQIQNSIDPIKLEVELAKEQALGRDTTKTLKKIRAAARKALASGKLSLDQQLQAWQEIKSINDQLADSTKTILGGFKELNTREIANRVHGLTREQRAELRAALSQQGPHHTGPRDGTGAYGYQIGRQGRPIHVHNHVTVDIDGKRADKHLAKHQQRRHRRNSHQRRGPNAGG